MHKQSGSRGRSVYAYENGGAMVFVWILQEAKGSEETLQSDLGRTLSLLLETSQRIDYFLHCRTGTHNCTNESVNFFF